MYEISLRHAAGICKNYFEDQLKKSPKTITHIKSLMSYSGFRFKSKRDFLAYYKSADKKLHEVALYTMSFSTSGDKKRFYSFACIATPLNKDVYNSTTRESYTENYLKLQFFYLSTEPDQGFIYDLFEFPNYCEITMHAIVRVIQRIKTTKIENITNEIQSSAISMMNMFLALQHYPLQRWPRGMVIPSATGAFLVDIDIKTQAILYRTFVRDEMFDYQERSVDATREWLLKAKKAKDISPQLASELLNHKSNKWWWDPNKNQKRTNQVLR